MTNVISFPTNTFKKNDNKTRINDFKLNVLTNSEPHPARTDLYLPISTMEVVEIAKGEGFYEFSLDEMRIGRDTKSDFAVYKEHSIVLYNPELTFSGINSRDFKAGILITNSYDGTCRLQVRPFAKRLYCDNGLAFPIFEELEYVAKIHKASNCPLKRKEVLEDIREGIKRVINLLNEKVISKVISMTEMELSEDEQNEFALEAMRIRLKDVPNADIIKTLKGENTAASLLTNWAYLNEISKEEQDETKIEMALADNGDSLWNVFNRVQRNLELNFKKGPMNIYYQFSKEKIDEKGTKTVISGTRKLTNLRDFRKVAKTNSELMELAFKFLEKRNQQNFEVESKVA